MIPSNCIISTGNNCVFKFNETQHETSEILIRKSQMAINIQHW